ncbi:MAG: helix-turn-helix domain-containing protein [Actinomycetales bacterium]
MASGPTLIASVQRALHLLDAVASGERPATAKELARAVGLPLPTTYHLLRTLVHEGYLRKLEDGYTLGERLTALTQRGSMLTVLSRVRPIMRAVRDELRGACYLSLYSHGEIKLVDIVDSPEAPRVDLWVGVHEAAHATAFGKCILSGLDAEARRDYLSRHRLTDLTPAGRGGHRGTAGRCDRPDRVAGPGGRPIPGCPGSRAPAGSPGAVARLPAWSGRHRAFDGARWRADRIPGRPRAPRWGGRWTVTPVRTATPPGPRRWPSRRSDRACRHRRAW